MFIEGEAYIFNKLFFFLRDDATLTSDDIITLGDLAKKAYFLWNSFQKTKNEQDVQDIAKFVKIATSLFKPK